jgi:hypothetical protein
MVPRRKRSEAPTTYGRLLMRAADPARPEAAVFQGAVVADADGDEHEVPPAVRVERLTM